MSSNKNDIKLRLIDWKHILYKELEKGISSLEKEENRKVKCDVAFVQAGGTYTMNFRENW